MKTIKTALGVKRIEDRDQHLALLQLRELLDAHRNALITRLLGNLPTYLEYRFGTRINQKQLLVLKDKLSFMKNASVDMDKYDFLYQHMLSNATTYVPSEPFYKEIDENIGWYLNDADLKSVI